MAKLTRYLQKIFANNSNQVGVFGTGVDKETSKNVETLQSADYEEGWSSAIITNKNYPIWQEMDGVQYGLSYQLKYLFQNGIPEWLSTETYYTNQFCAFGSYIYQSLQDNNINHNPALNNGYWTVYSSIPEDRLHALKGYSDEGELLTDAEGLQDVIDYAHSTFDLSKFTVVGSPIITSDGIASGFSSSNCLTIPSITITKNTSATIKIRHTLASTVSDNDWLFKMGFYDNNPSAINLFVLQSTLQARMIVANTNADTPIDAPLTAGKTYDFCLIVKDGAAKLEVTDIETNITISSTSIILANDFSCVETPTIGLSSNTFHCYGSIDLKQFSITVDGVPVFSGNKTGIDTIKPDDYTVVGTPTISADGIASGFSTSNYLKSPSAINLSSTTNWEINISFTTGIISNQTILNLGGYAGLNIYNGYLTFTNGSTPQYVNNINNAQANSLYELKIGCDGTNYYIKYKLNGVEQTEISQMASVSLNNSVATLGYHPEVQQIFLGSIDINSFKIYVDGNLIYQPCLKIPYTESKTGSKVVDANYRNRVNDVAGQLGYANYYTLDEDNGNFTLPQVELYGLINKIKQETPYIIDSYINGANGYITLSNGLHIERGVVISTSDPVNITFYKTFKDTNYSFIQSFEYTANVQTDYPTKSDTKTTSGISIFSSSGLVHDWIAIGYIF